jgi:hypothetical protein
LPGIWKNLDMEMDQIGWANEVLPIESDAQAEWSKCCDALSLAAQLKKGGSPLRVSPPE